MNNLELLNANGLDESFFSQAEGVEKEKVEGSVKREKNVKDLGDGFYLEDSIFGGKRKRLFKKFIDGTVLYGFIIDKDGNVPLGEKETVDLGGGKKVDRAKLIPYPKDKGFTKGDTEGNYYYFPELPDFKKNKIAELEKLQANTLKAKQAQVDAENKSAAERAKAKKEAEDAEKKFQLQKAEAEAKAKSEEVKLAEQNRLKDESESKSKNRKILLIGGGVLVALSVGFFMWKKFKK
jgi:hypothetical protein